MNILALSAHTDDAELGAGGFLARAVERSDDVTSVAFSTGNPETGATWDEFNHAMRTFGIPVTNFGMVDFYFKHRNLSCYKARQFGQQRQEILDRLIGLRDCHEPDLVLVPSTTDIHQDHQVITAEAMRAFRKCSILGYELPWCNYEFRPTMYVELTADQLAKKQQALACYKSQQSRHYFDECAVDLARLRGMQIGVEYAEAFEVIRWVMR